MKYGFIYETINLITGERYIGKHARTQNPNDPDDSDYLGSGKILRYAIDKYGEENFSRGIICECDSEEELQDMERYYINLYDAVNSPKYYNIFEDANPPKLNNYKLMYNPNENNRESYIHPEEIEYHKNIGWIKGHKPEYVSPRLGSKSGEDTIQKLSESHKGKIRTKESLERQIASHSIYLQTPEGIKYREATSKRMKENNPMSDPGVVKRQLDSRGEIAISSETREKMRRAKLGNTNRLGIKSSEETKKKLRESIIAYRKIAVYQRVCVVCGKVFESKATNSKYCSDICRENRKEVLL